MGGLEIHPTIFQLNTPKPQGRRGLSLGGQDPFHRAPTCRHGMSNPRTVQERMLCPATPPPGLTVELGRQMHEKVRDVSDSVRKQWKAVTIFIVELQWVRKDQKKEMCTLGATSSQACWLCISPSCNPTPGSTGHRQGGQAQFLPPLQAHGVASRTPCIQRAPQLSEVEVQWRVPPPLSDTFTFTAALAQCSQDLGETGSTDCPPKKMLGSFSGPHNGSVSCSFPK